MLPDLWSVTFRRGDRTPALPAQGGSRSRPSLLRLVLVGPMLVVAVALTGCDSNPLNRQPISGKVTLAGQPLEKGLISFDSQEGPNYSSGGSISNGTYSIPAAKGLPPGKYRVRINATVPDPRLPAPPAGQRDERPGVEIIPEAFNARSAHVIEVTEGAKLYVDFEIPAR